MKGIDRMNQNIFPHPTEKDLSKFNAKTCQGIAYQIEVNTESDNDYGNLAREVAAFILKKLAENMNEDETLEQYFKIKTKECL